MDYSKMTDDELLAELKKIDDFDKYPLPISWYKKYNIPFSDKIVSTRQYIQDSHWLKCRYNSTTKWEVRDEPAPGGVRPVIEVPEVTAELTDSKYVDFINQIVSDNQQEKPQTLEDSKECNTTSNPPE